MFVYALEKNAGNAIWCRLSSLTVKLPAQWNCWFGEKRLAQPAANENSKQIIEWREHIPYAIDRNAAAALLVEPQDSLHTFKNITSETHSLMNLLRQAQVSIEDTAFSNNWMFHDCATQW